MYVQFSVDLQIEFSYWDEPHSKLKYLLTIFLSVCNTYHKYISSADNGHFIAACNHELLYWTKTASEESSGISFTKSGEKSLKSPTTVYLLDSSWQQSPLVDLATYSIATTWLTVGHLSTCARDKVHMLQCSILYVHFVRYSDGFSR